jgi:hypothetical protein
MIQNIEINIIQDEYTRKLFIVPNFKSIEVMTIVHPSEEIKWEFTEIKYGESIDKVPNLCFDITWGRILYDALSEIYKPRINATEEELKAVKYHLEDMRKLVFRRKK